MIAVFAAMDAEVGACFGGTPPPPSAEVDGFPVYDGGEIIVAKTGIGRRSQAAGEAVLARYSARTVLSAGVAGGLAPGMSVGDVVICRHVDHESHRHAGEETSVFCDQGLIRQAYEVAEALGLPACEGSSLTVDEAAWGPAEKAAHHAWKRHDIVEMESFWIGEAAVRRGIPFLTVRTISDTAEHELLQTGAMGEDGTFDAEAFQAWAQAHPELMEDWAKSAANARLAFGSLTRLLTAFLPLLAAEPVR